MRWALRRLGVPASVVDAIFGCTLQPLCTSCGKVHLLTILCQGCLASGTLWALLYDLVMFHAWHGLPRRDRILAVFAVRLLTGLILRLGTKVLVKCTRRGHMILRDVGWWGP